MFFPSGASTVCASRSILGGKTASPVRGAARCPTAGKGIANPLATILSVSMLLRYSFNQVAAADAIERAVSLVLDQGLRTGDIHSAGTTKVGTAEMGDAVVAALRGL